MIIHILNIVWNFIHFLAFKPKFAEPQRSRDERDDLDHHGISGEFYANITSVSNLQIIIWKPVLPILRIYPEIRTFSNLAEVVHEIFEKSGHFCVFWAVKNPPDPALINRPDQLLSVNPNDTSGYPNADIRTVSENGFFSCALRAHNAWRKRICAIVLPWTVEFHNFFSPVFATPFLLFE